MKILIACEYSGTVRDAFNSIPGNDAMSCDILETESPGPHYKGDVFDVINDGWDMMIAFPPCTHITISGSRWFKQKQKDGRQQQGIGFFMEMINAPIEKIAVENPVGIMSTKYQKPDQIIQPWQFGHDASKRTCLWLKGLPPLLPTNIIKKDTYANLTPSGQNKLGPSADRSKLRSKTYNGIAEAMAIQWSKYEDRFKKYSK